MNNPAYDDHEDDDAGQRLPVSNELKHNKRGVFEALFLWRDVLDGIVGNNPKVFKFLTLTTFGVAYHAYFFYCIYR